jgi:hypothetical protein
MGLGVEWDRIGGRGFDDVIGFMLFLIGDLGLLLDCLISFFYLIFFVGVFYYLLRLTASS